MAAIALAALALGQSGKPSPVAAQPFGLKGDVLGETLQDFRARNARVIRTRPDYPVPATKQFPQCTGDGESQASPSDDAKPFVVSRQDSFSVKESLSADVEKSVETEEEIRAEVVKCIAASSMNENVDFDDEGPTVPGIRAYRTIYYFFRGRLYNIESQLPGSEYRTLRTAFITKHGKPTVSVGQYTNRFGAKVTGEELRWKNSTSQINIGELDAVSNNVLLTIWHTALKAECEKAGALKDRGKDL
jgi:hypothetical protein